MSKLQDPKEVLQEFLRTYVKEPARSGLSDRHTNVTRTASGDGSTTEFTLPDTQVLCINSITIGGGDPLIKFVEYDIDLRNAKVFFATAPPVGSNNISVDYDYNTNGESWIYRDRIREDLTRSQYPRIFIQQVGETANLAGINSTKTLGKSVFQIDVVTKREVFMTLRSELKEGQEAVDIIAKQVANAIIKNNRNGFGEQLWEATQDGITPVPFNEGHNTFRSTLQFSFNRLDKHEEI